MEREHDRESSGLFRFKHVFCGEAAFPSSNTRELNRRRCSGEGDRGSRALAVLLAHGSRDVGIGSAVALVATAASGAITFHVTVMGFVSGHLFQ